MRSPSIMNRWSQKSKEHHHLGELKTQKSIDTTIYLTKINVYLRVINKNKGLQGWQLVMKGNSL